MTTAISKEMWITCRWVLNGDGPVHQPERDCQSHPTYSSNHLSHYGTLPLSTFNSVVFSPPLSCLRPQAFPLFHPIFCIIRLPTLSSPNVSSGRITSYHRHCRIRLWICVAIVYRRSTIDVYRIRRGRTRVSRITIDAPIGSISVHFSGTMAAFVGYHLLGEIVVVQRRLWFMLMLFVEIGEFEFTPEYYTQIG